MSPAEYKSLREEVGTQAVVSEMLGVTRITIARRETGAQVITTEAAIAIRALAGKGSRRKGDAGAP